MILEHASLSEEFIASRSTRDVRKSVNFNLKLWMLADMWRNTWGERSIPRIGFNGKICESMVTQLEEIPFKGGFDNTSLIDKARERAPR